MVQKYEKKNVFLILKIECIVGNPSLVKIQGKIRKRQRKTKKNKGKTKKTYILYIFI